MAFGIGINTQGCEEGTIRGKQEGVACDCWFSSSGLTIPRFIKYQDEQGEVHCMNQIQVIQKEKKHYCGIPFMEYRCKSIQEERCYEFTLLFHLEECCWKIIWK